MPPTATPLPITIDTIPAAQKPLVTDPGVVRRFAKAYHEHTATNFQIEEPGDGTIVIVVLSEQTGEAHAFALPALSASSLASCVAERYRGMAPEVRRKQIRDLSDKKYALEQIAIERERDAAARAAHARASSETPEIDEPRSLRRRLVDRALRLLVGL